MIGVPSGLFGKPAVAISSSSASQVPAGAFVHGAAGSSLQMEGAIARDEWYAHRGAQPELPQELEQLGGFHALCFSLQVMQTRVHGMAFSRAGAMGSPQSRQMP